MRIWLVNPFDPLPGDPEQEGRYASLARAVVGRGHGLTWWTSNFSHRFKRPVDQASISTACQEAGIDVRFLDAPPYRRNVGAARLRSHAILARRFAQEAASSTERPDVVLVSSPPPNLALRAVEYARAHGAKSLVDVQDAWPDAFSCLAPVWLRPALSGVIWAMRRTVRRTAAACDGIIGVADAYVDSFFKETDGHALRATIPLGIDLGVFDTAVRAGQCEQFTKPPGHVWLAYTGSLNRNYDCLTILHAAARLGDRLGDHIRFFLTSRGELAEQAQQIVRENKLTNVTLTGFLEFEPWAYLLSQCDVGFNASFPETMIFLPNKVFYYMAGGVVVLNTIPGQCSQIVREGGCGLDYEAGNVESCAQAIERMVRDRAARTAMQQASRRLAETRFDRALLSPQYAELIERVGAGEA